MGKFFGRHFGGMLDFKGRESRQPFWLWAAFVMAIQMVGTFAIMIPKMIGMFQQIEDFADAHPDQVTRTYGPGSYSVQVHGYHPELMPDFSGIMSNMGILALAAVMLLAAAVVRRLHDCDRTGTWGLLPLPFLAAAFILMPRMAGGFADGGGEPDFSLFVGLFLNNLVYLVALGVLIALCAQNGTAGENRFGPPVTG